jgi:hypothetical protein
MSIEESWAECERQARNLLGAERYARLKAEIVTPRTTVVPDADVVKAQPAQTGRLRVEQMLFGDNSEGRRRPY